MIVRRLVAHNRLVLACLVTACTFSLSPCEGVLHPARATELGVQGNRFTIDGRPAFLLGISYYGALGGSEEQIRQDLEEFQRAGFNWIRVWATWAAFERDVSAVDAEGHPREPYLSKLKWLIDECDRRGIIVDVTLSRGNGIVGPPRLQTPQAHERAVRTLLTALGHRSNWYLDLANERNIRDRRYVPVQEAARLCRLVHRLDSTRLVTVSHSGDLGTQELRDYVLRIGVDFLAVHRPRNPRSARQTHDVTRRYLQHLRELGRLIPVHYQEPFRRNFSRGWEPLAEDYLTDLRGALNGGAAGWCLHNGANRHSRDGRPRRSFDLRSGRLMKQLDSVELDVFRRAPSLVRALFGAARF